MIQTLDVVNPGSPLNDDSRLFSVGLKFPVDLSIFYAFKNAYALK